jgi:hypothetical protein
MLKKILPLLVLFLSIPSLVYAQSDLTLAKVIVELWPEYDKPEMLVINHINLPAGILLPAKIKWRIPAEAGKPNAVADLRPDGSLVDAAYDQTRVGEWLELDITATTPELQIEYYDPGLVKEGAHRQFAYRWPGDYAVDSLVLSVQQPVGASNMDLPASFSKGSPGKDGLLYYNADVGELPVGQQFDLELSYDKPDDELSVAAFQVEPASPIAQTSSAPSFLTILPYILGVLGLALIGGSVWWYVRSSRGKRGDKSARSRHKPAAQREAAGDPGHVYCHSCGKRAMAGDQFCRVCGMQLRNP